MDVKVSLSNKSEPLAAANNYTYQEQWNKVTKVESCADYVFAAEVILYEQ